MPAPITISSPTYAFPLTPDQVARLLAEHPELGERCPALPLAAPGMTVRVSEAVADAIFDRYTDMLRRSHHVPIPDPD